MKKYIFKNGTREAENLTGTEIKECERKLGKLISVSNNGRITPVYYPSAVGMGARKNERAD